MNTIVYDYFSRFAITCTPMFSTTHRCGKDRVCMCLSLSLSLYLYLSLFQCKLRREITAMTMYHYWLVPRVIVPIGFCYLALKGTSERVWIVQRYSNKKRAVENGIYFNITIKTLFGGSFDGLLLCMSIKASGTGALGKWFCSIGLI